MQVSCPNDDIKIYNLSHGKSLPEFLSDQKKRALLKKDSALRQRIELIQDFTMPTVTTTVKTTPDGQHIFATGTYKPRIKCFDVKQLSLKFERYLDAEAVNFLSLSEDYTKLVLLLNDRSVEFHTQQGKHYKVRIPTFGRDLTYNSFNCDLMLAGSGPEVYRINLEQGQFMKSYETSMSEIHSCVTSPDHHLLAVGGKDGIIECWDPRSRTRAGSLNVGPGLVDHLVGDFHIPTVKVVKYHKSIELIAGTSTGQVMMYDMRTNKPYLVKDHRYDLPINSVFYNDANEVMVSSDSRVVKIWDVKTGVTRTAIESEPDINCMHLIDDSGLLFLANESPKIFSYFLPWLGRAPKWCYILDNLVEGQEEKQAEIYDDYKFVTKKELETLGLSNLVGTNMLRAYMHGYFLDIRLYQKAVSVAKPFAYEEYRKKKLAEKVNEKRDEDHIKLKKSTKVNKRLVERLVDRITNEEEVKGKKKKAKIEAGNLLKDPRFSAMFENPEFQIDEDCEEFRLLNPVISQKVNGKRKREESSDEEDNQRSEDSSSDEEVQRKWVQEAKKAHTSVFSKEKALREKKKQEDKDTLLSQPKMFKIKNNLNENGDKVQFTTLADLEKYGGKTARKERKRLLKVSMEDRIKAEESRGGRMIAQSNSVSGGKQSTFYIKNDKKSKEDEENQTHQAERRKVRRPADKIKRQKKDWNSGFFKR